MIPRGVLVVAVLAFPARVWAHQSAVKYADLRVRGNDVDVAIQFQPADVTRPLGLADDASPTVDQALAHADVIGPPVSGWLRIRSGAAGCSPTLPALSSSADDPRFLVIRWIARCEGSIETLVLDLSGFFAVDRGHEMVLHLTAPATDPYDTTIGAADSPLTLDLREHGPETASGWIRDGAFGFAFGADRVVFVLVLMSVLPGFRGGGALVRSAGIVIAALCVGVSVGAATGTLGWMASPQGFLTAMAGLTIVCIAVENLLAPASWVRVFLALGFGFVHGLTLAGPVASPLSLGGGHGRVPGLAVGMALGAIALAALALAACVLGRRLVGSELYGRRIMPGVSIVAAAWGAIGVVHRVLG